MAWGRMDDKFHRNKKVRKLRSMGRIGREALGLWVFWWSWCLDDQDLTGIVPSEEIGKDELKLAKLLCSDLYDGRGLWVEVDGGFFYHDFHEYNPTREQRERKLDADRRGAAERRAKSQQNTDPVARDVASDSHTTRIRIAGESLPCARAGSGWDGTYKREDRETLSHSRAREDASEQSAVQAEASGEAHNRAAQSLAELKRVEAR